MHFNRYPKSVALAIFALTLAGCTDEEINAALDAQVRLSTGHGIATVETIVDAGPAPEPEIVAEDVPEPVVEPPKPVLTWDTPECRPVFRVNENPCDLPGTYWEH